LPLADVLVSPAGTGRVHLLPHRRNKNRVAPTGAGRGPDLMAGLGSSSAGRPSAGPGAELAILLRFD
jgi:hypothetical protein